MGALRAALILDIDAAAVATASAAAAAAGGGGGGHVDASLRLLTVGEWTLSLSRRVLYVCVSVYMGAIFLLRAALISGIDDAAAIANASAAAAAAALRLLTVGE
jgi:hypothetical protein